MMIHFGARIATFISSMMLENIDANTISYTNNYWSSSPTQASQRISGLVLS
jgi:hypothetical protein